MPLPRQLLGCRYHEAAQRYLRSLPPEHFMEATAQATQRKITLESLDLVHAARPEIQVFNELLVQYPRDPEHAQLGQVVPDNMVVVWREPIVADTSYDVPLQPVGPYWTLEYVSKTTRRKDYEVSFQKYEQELQVPYYFLFVPDAQEMTLYKLTKGRYQAVRPNREERLEIPKLDLELGIVDGWVRYWFQGKLLALPAELQHNVDELTWQLAQERRQTREYRRRAEQEAQRAEQEAQRAEQEKHRADQENSARLAAETELARLRLELQRLQKEAR